MKWLLKKLIQGYKRFMSPLLGARCKYYPSCSSYALGAVERFGALGGTVLAAWRLLRCNPFSRGGIDYVPEHFTDAFRRRKKH